MFTVYTKSNCQYCDQAKALLRSKNLRFEEIHIAPMLRGDGSRNEILLEEFKLQFPQVRSAPLILQDGFVIGGFSELRSLISEQKNVLLG